MLVSEDMFRSVAFARDRWLCEGGQMLPQRCRLHAAPFSHDDFVEKQTGFWGSKPYGVDLSILAFHALDQHICRPVIQILKEEQLLGNSCLLFDLDCKNAARDDARKQECKFLSRIKQPGRFHGVAAWFDCELVPGVHFTTGPEGIATHWEQTLLFLDPASEIMDLMLDEGDEIEGELRWLVAGKDLGVVVLGKVRRKDGTASNDEDLRFGRRLAATLLRQKESADFKALELELVNGIRTTQAAQVKLQQDIVAAGGQVATNAAAFLQQKRPSKAMKAFSDVMVATRL
eukprot:symbB.v1.2.023843.t1/scaffold2213.1/size114990/4